MSSSVASKSEDRRGTVGTKSGLETRGTVRVEDLGRRILEKRRGDKLTLKEVSQRTGVSAATLSRLEKWPKTQGSSSIVPDIRTLTALVQWLGTTIDRFVDTGTAAPAQSNTPDAVEAHLRADRNLAPEVAAKLADLFRIAYEQLAGLSDRDDRAASRHERRPD